MEETLHSLGEGAGAAEPLDPSTLESGVTEADAVPQSQGVNQPESAAAPAAQVQPDCREEALRKARFQQLITGEYKDLYDSRVQEILHKRLKNARETLQKYEALQPLLELLGRQHGVDAADIPALTRALEAKSVSCADDHGPSYAAWLRQSQQLQGLYPDFDLAQELEDPQFRNLLHCDIPVQTAYEVLHRQQLLAAAAQDLEQKLVRRIAAAGARPQENGLCAQSPASVKTDVSRLSRQDIDEVIRRVSRGERITFA